MNGILLSSRIALQIKSDANVLQFRIVLVCPLLGVTAGGPWLAVVLP